MATVINMYDHLWSSSVKKDTIYVLARIKGLFSPMPVGCPMAHSLSALRRVGPTWAVPRFSSSRRIDTTSLDTSLAAIYSDCMVQVAVIGWRNAIQVVAPPLRMKTIENDTAVSFGWIQHFGDSIGRIPEKNVTIHGGVIPELLQNRQHNRQLLSATLESALSDYLKRCCLMNHSECTFVRL